MDQENVQLLKKQAAEFAVGFIESGMVVGLGEGSTAVFGIVRLGELLRSGDLKDIVGIPCSAKVEKTARENNIPIGALANFPQIDLTFDGADEIDPDFNLIKGGGGGLAARKNCCPGKQARNYCGG